ncbi:MAG: alpha/beta hydrolase [Deltaproteobacteria bacterium]|nr:alpha/beta hydrolase [Deltaproteobacteria bacterium]
MGIEQRQVTVEGSPARVFVGGEGAPLVLVHGGWGDARVHWRPVWERLAERFRVIAPDLPGLGWTEQPSLGTYARYARWLAGLLDALGVESAQLVGNSFGGSVVWRFGGDFPARCRGLVLVNGLPVGRTPRPMLWIGRTGFGRALMRAIARRVAYTPAALGRAFPDAAKAPPEVVSLLHQREPPQLAALTACIIEGDGGPAPSAPTLLLWGEADRLIGTNADAARKLQARIPGAELHLIPGAGHFPQVEEPAAFIAALEAFVTRR